MTYSNYDAEVNNLFELLGWKSLVSQRQIERATMYLSPYRDWHLSISARNLSIGDHRDSSYCLREAVNIVNVPQPRTNYYKNSFSHSGAVLWNSLPLELRKAESLNQFKRLIKEVI